MTDKGVRLSATGHYTIDLPAKNTDREIWRGPDEGNGSYYADSIHVTEGGSIGMNCGGHVIAMPIRRWHEIAKMHLESVER